MEEDTDRGGIGLGFSSAVACVRPVGNGSVPLAPALSGARSLKPAPPAFAEIFVRFGWRGVEVVYGSRTSCNARWIEQCGGKTLKAERRDYRNRLQGLRRTRRSC